MPLELIQALLPAASGYVRLETRGARKLEATIMSAATQGLYKDAYERDSCGFGLIANLDDQPSHWLVRTAITSLNRLTHRGAIAGDGKTGDGCGLLLKKPEGFLRAVATELRLDGFPRASGP